MQQLVSVVMATYNGEKFLVEQLQSILSQTYAALEIIICDDASTDNTKNIILQYAAADSRIRYHFNQTNTGLNKNFENGFKMASAAYIAIADQDDIWKPEKIEEQMKLFAGDVALVHSASAIFRDKIPTHKTTATLTKPMTGNDTRKLLLRNSISWHNIIFKKELLQFAIPFPAKTYYDWWLCIHATCVGSIAATNKVLAYQRHHSANVTISGQSSKTQTVKEYDERKIALRNFLTISTMEPAAKKFAKELYHQLQTLEQKKFSASYFSFLVQNASTLFFYKKKKFPLFSYLKTAWSMSHNV
ncbi:MAG: glycosyltransferase [Ferruginibacter sp.]